MGLQLIEGGLDFPALMVKRRQFPRRSQGRIGDGGDQAVEGLGPGDRLRETGVWLFGSVVRSSGLTRFEVPPLSPASSERSTGMVPVAVAIVAL